MSSLPPPRCTAPTRTKSARKTGEGYTGSLTEFDSRAGVSRLQPYPRLAHASYSLRKATTPNGPVPLLEPNRCPTSLPSHVHAGNTSFSAPRSTPAPPPLAYRGRSRGRAGRWSVQDPWPLCKLPARRVPHLTGVQPQRKFRPAGISSSGKASASLRSACLYSRRASSSFSSRRLLGPVPHVLTQDHRGCPGGSQRSSHRIARVTLAACSEPKMFSGRSSEEMHGGASGSHLSGP